MLVFEGVPFSTATPLAVGAACLTLLVLEDCLTEFAADDAPWRGFVGAFLPTLRVLFACWALWCI